MDHQLTDKTLLTIEVTRGELRSIKANSRTRGMTMSSFIRSLLAAQNVDLERVK